MKFIRVCVRESPDASGLFELPEKIGTSAENPTRLGGKRPINLTQRYFELIYYSKPNTHSLKTYSNPITSFNPSAITLSLLNLGILFCPPNFPAAFI